MASKVDSLPETMTSPETGAMLKRGTRQFTVAYKGAERTVDLSGYYPEGEGEAVHIGSDLAIIDEALRHLKEQIDNVPTPTTIKRVRKKLQLSQREAGILLRVGENAFDKYERGLVEPSGPTCQLLRILDSNPEIAQLLR